MESVGMSEDNKEPIMHTRTLEDEFGFQADIEALLQKDEDSLYEELFKRSHKPGIIIEGDTSIYKVRTSWGKRHFEGYLSVIKSKFCLKWQSMKKSGIYDDAVALVGVLLGQDVPVATATVISAIAVKRGLDKICQS
jgi:hypothetical protein